MSSTRVRHISIKFPFIIIFWKNKMKNALKISKIVHVRLYSYVLLERFSFFEKSKMAAILNDATPTASNVQASSREQ